MQMDVHQDISSCNSCTQAKVPRALNAGELLPLPIPQQPFSHIAIDLITYPLESQGYTTIFVIVDLFSKSLHFLLPSVPTTFETTELLFNHLFRYFVILEDIISDWDPSSHTKYGPVSWTK